MSDQPGPSQSQPNLPDPGQAGPQLALVLEPDRKSVHLRIGQDGKLMAGIVLNTENLEGLMENLVQIRERMLPAPSIKPLPASTPAVLPEAPESVSTEFSPGLAREIKGTHYDFAISDNGQQLIFSVRDQGMGWLSFRFGARLLSAKKRT